MRVKTNKGQMAGMNILLGAVFVVVGLIVFFQVYQSVPITNLQFNESLGNQTNAPNTIFTGTVDNSPLYEGPTTNNGQNATGYVLEGNGSASALTLVSGPLTGQGDNVFNLSSASSITANTSTNGTVYLVYWQVRGAAAYQPTVYNIESQTADSMQLLAVGLIALAAVFILGLVMSMGRRS